MILLSLNFIDGAKINPYQPKVFGKKFSLREIARIVSIIP